MKREEIHERLGKVAVEAAADPIDWSKVDDATTIESLGFDSLTILDLLYDLQEEFGVEIEAKQVLEIATVGEMVDFLAKRIDG